MATKWHHPFYLADQPQALPPRTTSCDLLLLPTAITAAGSTAAQQNHDQKYAAGTSIARRIHGVQRAKTAPDSISRTRKIARPMCRFSVDLRSISCRGVVR
jgi:hypothetical protein